VSTTTEQDDEAVPGDVGRLFDAHAGPLHGYLARRVGAEVAHDLVSETFLVALRSGYDPLRATARAAKRTPAAEPSHDGRVAERIDAQALAAQLAGALAQLSQGDRDVLLLTSWAGLDSNEVSEALDIPVGTVRSRLHRTRKWLRANASKGTTR
jgi:RNA polymerase sigma-70 factor (ECF subfamily)